MPTIKDIAKKCKVAVSTVSRALNDATDINEKTKRKVLKAAKTLGYVSNLQGRQLRQPNTTHIAYYAPNPATALSQQAIESKHHMGRAIQEQGYTALFIPPNNNQAEDHANQWRHDMELIISQRPCGIICEGPLNNSEEIVSLCKKNKLPIVLINLNSQHCDTLVANQHAGALDAIEHLIETNKRNIVTFAPAHGDAPLRIAHLQALTNHDIPITLSHLPSFSPKPDDNLYEYGYQETDALLEKNIAIDAIIMPHDEAAIGAMAAIARRGKKIPQDIAVIGFHDTQAAAYCTPPLSTVLTHPRDIATQACQILADRILASSNAPPTPLRHQHINAVLVLRESC